MKKILPILPPILGVLPFLILLAIAFSKIVDAGGGAIKTGMMEGSLEVGLSRSSSTSNFRPPANDSASFVKPLVGAIKMAGFVVSDESDPSDSLEVASGDEKATEKPVKDCGEGKFLNPKTNRCKNLQTVSETSTGKTITTYDPKTGEATVEKICNPGYELNAETNRCNKIKAEKSDKQSSQKSDEKTTKTSSSKTSTNTGSKTSSSASSKATSDHDSKTKDCGEGKFLNPKTNRCKNLQTVSESTTGKTVTTFDPKTGESTTKKICNSGYELDVDSNRCKKKKENAGDDYVMEVPKLGNETDFIAIGSVIAIVAIGIGFVVFEFRHEIAKFIKKIKVRRTPKDMV